MQSDDDSFCSACSSSELSNLSFCSATDTLGGQLRIKFDQANRHLLNICHINAQSVPSHYSDLYEAFLMLMYMQSWFLRAGSNLTFLPLVTLFPDLFLSEMIGPEGGVVVLPSIFEVTSPIKFLQLLPLTIVRLLNSSSLKSA